MSKEKTPQGKMDDAAILEKHSRGEELTPEESDFIAGAPNLEQSPDPAPKEGEDIPEGDTPEGDTPDEGEKPAEGEENPDEGAEATPSPTKDGEKETPEGEEPEENPDEPTETGPTAKETPEQKTAKERRKLIDAELGKPDNLLDLSKFTATELGLFWDLRKERKKRQRAEAETNVHRFREMQRQIAEEETPDETPAEETPEEDPLAEIGDDEVLTGAELKERLKKKPAVKPAAKPAKKETPAAARHIITVDQLRVQKVEAHGRLSEKGIKDFYDVIDNAEEALAGDVDAQEELRETAKTGGNVAERTYFLIKGSKKWPEIEKRIKKPAGKTPAPENKDRAERLRQNTGKIKTTGSSNGGGNVGGYTREQVASMSANAFAKLPKKTQDAILWQFGSDPNLNV